MSMHIAVDVGGTQIRVATFKEAGIKPVRQKRIPTIGAGTAVERIMGLIEELYPQDDSVAAIGIAAPGPTNPKIGVIYTAPNIPGWVNLPLAALLRERFHVPVYLGNDANMAAVGEWKFGAGQGHHNLLYLTVSTGIGGGVISDDQLLLGEQGMATELGHIVVDPNGPLCGCGQRGHLEAFSSGTGIARWAKEQVAQGVESSLAGIPAPSSKDISLAAQAGDALALAAYQRAGEYLGIGVANYLHIFNPSIVIFGGGVSRAGELLFKPFRESLYQHVMSPAFVNELVITTAALGDDAGLMGALALARCL